MNKNTAVIAYYIIKENDLSGKSAHGPYMKADAESRLNIDERLLTQTELASLRKQPVADQEEQIIDEQGWSLNQDKMWREIRSWGFFLIVIGLLQMVVSGILSNTWGILLIIVGLASFYFRSVSMFVIYGTTLAWAGISNALSGSGSWFVFSLLQAYFAFQTFRQFFRFRAELAYQSMLENEGNQRTQSIRDKAARTFPWLSLFFGLVSLVGLATVFMGAIIIVGFSGNEVIPPFINFIEGLVINFAVLGLAVGLASILSKYHFKLASLVGMIAGTLVLLIQIGLILLV